MKTYLTQEAMRACANFLAECLKLGWRKSELYELERYGGSITTGTEGLYTGQQRSPAMSSETKTPSEASMKAAEKLVDLCPTHGEEYGVSVFETVLGSDDYEWASELLEQVREDLALALDAAEKRGMVKGLEEGAQVAASFVETDEQVELDGKEISRNLNGKTIHPTVLAIWATGYGRNTTQTRIAAAIRQRAEQVTDGSRGTDAPARGGK